MTPGGVARRFIGVVLVVFALVALGLAAGSADASMSVALDYGGDAAAYDDTCHVASGLGAGRPAAVCGDAAAVHRGEIASSPGHPRAGQQFRPGRSRVAPGSTGSRFVVNGAGDVLDSARVTIPEGEFGYLLEDPSKAGVFGNAHPGAMGFSPDSLDTALRTHLVDNFGSATSSVPMVGGGTKFSVTGPMTGPNGNTWTITTAWGVDTNGTIRLITGTP